MNAIENGGGGVAGSAAVGISMPAVEGMSKQHLKPIHRDVEAIREHGISRGELQEALDPTNHDMQQRSDRIEVLEQSGTRSPSIAPPSTRSGAVITSQIEGELLELERQFTEPTTNQERECNAVVIGGAVQFLQDHIRRRKAPEQFDIFVKGDLNSTVFAKFASVTARDTLVKTIGKAQIQRQSSTAWTHAGNATEKQVPESSWFGLRNLFPGRGYSKPEAEGGATTCKLTAAKATVVAVS
eukprot:1498658-Pyramimonas_sp.AAC.1